MKNIKQHKNFILAFSFTLLFFLGPVFFMQKSFFGGDSFVQFLPWLKSYSLSLKNLHFPYWIRQIGSGFPLMAEGQIGGYYPLNILMFFALPFRAAYSYSALIHFLIAGLFTYIYLRQLGSSQLGGYIGALIFCFGSSYAGCFYNIVTLRTLAWFPAVLYFLELYLKRDKIRYIIYASIIFGCQFLAGFVQMAAYSSIFYIGYYLYKSKLKRKPITKNIYVLFTFLGIAFLISLPQLILTLQLAGHSARTGADIEFALWRSFSPIGFFSLIYPYPTAMLNYSLHVGLLSLLFVIYSFFRLKKADHLKPILLILFLSIFFALGKYNPLYVLMLKCTHFYSFRNPSKFLFFSAFALSVLAGLGFTDFFKDNDEGIKRRTMVLFRQIIVGLTILLLPIIFLLRLFKNQILNIGDWYVQSFILGKMHHRHSIEYYAQKVESIYEILCKQFSYTNIFVLFSVFLAVTLVIIAPALLKRKNKIFSAIVIFIELFVFSFYSPGFSSQLRSFDILTPDNPNILSLLKEDKELFRVLPFDINSDELPNWSIPNANILYSIDSVAVYTPLADRSYREELVGLEVVDDSLGLKPARKDALVEKLDTIRLLNTKYLISREKLDENFLNIVTQDKKLFLYEVRGCLPRVFFTYDLGSDIRTRRIDSLKILSYTDGMLEVEVEAKKNGFIVFSERFYPGWVAYVDGRKTDIIKVKNIIQAVPVNRGKHNIQFAYKPDFLKINKE